MRVRSRWMSAILFGAARASTPAQSIPVIDLPPASAKSAETFGAIINIRELPQGRVLVSDGKNFLVKLLTATLATERIVLDSSRTAANTYGNFPMPLVSYIGDSTLFNSSRGLFVIGPGGNVARAAALPQPKFWGQIRRAVYADDKGRVVFMAASPVTRTPTVGVVPTVSDSAPLLRIDFAARTTDTIAWVGRPYVRVDAWQPPPPGRGAELSFWLPDPLKALDDWTILSDGSIAIVRGHDYRVDWLRSDGTRVSSSKLPFDWKQMTQIEKTRLIDTVEAQRVAAAQNNALLMGPEHPPTPWPRGVLSGSTDPNAPTRPTFDTTKAIDTRIQNNARVLARMPDRPKDDDVNDYYPPIRVGSALADVDDRLWILPTLSRQSKAGELVYDVVSSKGALLERVRVPLGRYIVGFGRNGVVYLAVGGLSTGGFTLERTKLPASR
jgi:hypothetical protein